MAATLVGCGGSANCFRRFFAVLQPIQDKPMATTTLGVKLDDATRDRLKHAAQSIDRTPHWLIKQAIFNYLEQIEGGLTPAEHSGLAAVAGGEKGGELTGQRVEGFFHFAQNNLPPP